MNIRDCLPADLPEVCNLIMELSKYTDTVPPKLEDIRGTFEAMTLMPSVYRNFVGQESDRTIAFLSMVVYRTMLHPGGTALVNELVVAPDYRGRGIARALVAYATDCAKEAGAMEIEAGTEFTNERARRFYRGAGFTKEFLLFNREIRR